MKIKYPKPRTFPRYASFNETEGNRYIWKDNGVEAQFVRGGKTHYNHIETSGFGSSCILSYRIDGNRKASLYRLCVFPSCRVNPDNTHGSLTCVPRGIQLQCEGRSFECTGVRFDGVITFFAQAEDVTMRHDICASRDARAVVEKYVLENRGKNAVRISMKNPDNLLRIRPFYTADGKGYSVYTDVYSVPDILAPGAKAEIFVSIGVDRLDKEQIEEQFAKRRSFISLTDVLCQVITPDPVVNAMARMCKIRASESIYNTAAGLMHSPGGGGYYAALWTNDQCEYVNPFFAYLGYDEGVKQSYNCYALYKHLVREDRAVYTSIIAEGRGYWHGAKDRGDTSMYVYGLCRFLLARGDRETARGYLDTFDKARKYMLSQTDAQGIVHSDSDELENRFQSGTRNLSTQVLTADAFLSLSYLYDGLDMKDDAAQCRAVYDRLVKGLKEYYSANVEGYETYRYCDKESKLRSWICLPLTIGITDRAEGTVAALTGDKLVKGNGILTRSGEKTYWDRSALYALRGMFYAGYADKAAQMLAAYSRTRLLKEHVPYPVEAYPEGNAAHLSAESGLYMRIFTEGLFGYRPTGFDTFDLMPHLPSDWDKAEIRNITLCGISTDLKAERKGDKYEVTVFGKSYTVDCGKSINIGALCKKA